ncbi:MAG: hypothetical protein KF773_12830 [Deltaproteobacteria bacterium]|nr:hypothetical protein [Deltaproteobacteria bacterium]MCW5801466.1 hypothetical protein [Deltaproteobacteria bacterium]
MRRSAVLAALLAACGSKPAPKKPPAELAVDGPASIAGEWVVDDDMGWYHTLAIAADGAFTLSIDRGKLAPCQQAGRLSPGDKARAFSLALSKDTCHPDAASATVAVEIGSFTGESLTLVVTGTGGAERRTYQRKPRS